MQIQTKNPSVLQEFDPKMHDTILIAGWLIGKSERTQKTYKKVIRSFFEYHTKISISQTTTAHITTFLKDAENRQVKASTLNLYLNALSSLFRFAVKQRKMDQDPTQGLKNYRIQNTVHQKIMYLDQIQQMLLKTKRPRDILLIKILFYLGLRVSEVTLIVISDFSFFKDGVVLNIKGKGSKVRQTPISEELWSEIKEYIAANDLRSSSYLFNDEKNEYRQLSTFAIWRAVKSAGKRAKINPLPSTHWFRHTCATMSMEGGAPIHLVQARLGHASLSTTQQYLHAKPDEGLGKYLPKV